MGVRKPADDNVIRQLYREGKSHAKIAEYVCLTEQGVQKRIQKMGLPPRPNPARGAGANAWHAKAGVREEVERLWMTPATSDEIGAKFGVTGNSIIGQVHRWGFPHKPKFTKSRPVVATPVKPAAPPKPGKCAWPGYDCTEPAVAGELFCVVCLAAERIAARKDTEATKPRVEVPKMPHGGRRIIPAPRPVVVAVRPAPVVLKPYVPVPGSKPCCFPLWGAVKPTHEYCGRPVAEGLVYCPDHWRITHIAGSVRVAAE